MKLCGEISTTPRVARNTKRNGGSILDGPTTLQVDFEIRPRKRKRIEECFG